MPSRATPAAAWAAFVLYATVLLLPDPASESLVRVLLWNGVLANLVYVLPAAMLVRRAARHPQERARTLPLAVAVCLALAGNLVYAVMGSVGVVVFPSVADLLSLCVYPLLLLGLLAALREHLHGLRPTAALDGLAGLLAGGALACWAVAPLIARLVGARTLADVALLAYPVCAVVLIAASLGALGLAGPGRGWPVVLWTLGAVAFGIGDILYAYRLAGGGYVPGSLLDAVWPLGLLMLAHGATQESAPRARALPVARSLAVVAVSAVAAVAVLAVAPPWSANPLPALLSLMALTVCSVRLVKAFLLLRELTAVRELALTDELTGAANRRALHTALDTRFASPAGWTDEGFTFALIDLDHFKEVNDSYGHAVGDDLLRAVVHRFTVALERLETPHLLARLGGDEFGVLLHAVGSHDAAMACGAALRDSLCEPVQLDGVSLHVQASIGLALAPEHGQGRADILFAADAAMYAAKSSAEPVRVYAPEETGDRRRRLEVAEDLFSALERGELAVDYQPIRTRQGALFGVEALVRWDHPTRGRLSPDEFLAIAERYRLTPCIAHRVLDVALADLSRWRAEGLVSRLSVNVSASDLRDEALVDTVAAALLRYDVPPAALTIEITETAMMVDPATAHSVMHALHTLGVELSVDDYGTGYSSLEYLLKLPIHELKLDRAFTADLADQTRSVAIVRSTVDLTHALGLRMVAEGVEDARTLTILAALGCDLVQGWHTGVPMRASELSRVLGGQPVAQPSPQARPATTGIAQAKASAAASSRRRVP